MAKDGKKLSKGFGFYLLILLFIVVVAFVIVVGIMMMMPKKNILGYQYFYYNQTAKVSGFKTGTNAETGEDILTDFYFHQFDEIDVNCGASSVSVLRSDSEKDEIKFTANISGFAKASTNVDYAYEVKKEGRVLSINVIAPAGFLHFAYDVKVEILVGKTSGGYLNDTAFNMTSTSGNLQIGTTVKDEEMKENVIEFGKTTVKTTSGRVNLTNSFDTPYLDVSTTSGNFICGIEHFFGNQLKFSTNSGSVKLDDVIVLENPIELSLGNGKLTFEEIYGNLNVRGQNFTINGTTLKGNLSANDRNINKANVKIDEVTGDVSFPYANESNLNFIKVGGEIYIETTKGNVTIGGERKEVKVDDAVVTAAINRNASGLSKTSFIKTESGRIDVVVNDAGANPHYFESTTGSVYLEYRSPVTGKNYVASQKGNVTIKTYSNNLYQFKFLFKNSKGEQFTQHNSKLSVDLIWEKDYDGKGELRINGYQGDSRVIDIATDGRISCQLLEI